MQNICMIFYLFLEVLVPDQLSLLILGFQKRKHIFKIECNHVFYPQKVFLAQLGLMPSFLALKGGKTR